MVSRSRENFFPAALRTGRGTETPPEYISQLLGEQGVEDAVFVADSALVSKENLAELADGGMDFVTLLPGTFSLEKELKESAWREETWTDLGALARDPDEKSARYKAWSVREEIEGREYDFLVVHSTKLEALKERSLKGRFDRLGVELRKECLALRKREFACEEDARRGGAELLEKVVKQGFAAVCSVELEEKAVRGKGRPKKDAPPPATNRTWRAVVEIGEVEEKAWKSAMERESTFVLVYRMEKAVERKNPAEILRTYKNQNVVEQGFRFLKQPIYLGPVLLKKPERVEALGYVFLLVLLLAKYLEYRVRAALEKEGDALRVGGQKLARPTTQTILYHFGTVPLLESGGKRFMPNPPGGNGARIMDALGFTWELYTHGDCEDRFMERCLLQNRRGQKKKGVRTKSWTLFRDGRMSMYSREKKVKAVELYIKYDKSAADVIRELGYPNRHTLRSWYAMYLEEVKTGVIRDRYMRAPKFTEKQKETAVRYYLDHGRNYSRTVRALGYSNRTTLSQWCRELAPEACKKRKGRIHSTEEQKRKAVEALCTTEGSARKVAEAHEVSRPTLYQWKNALLGKEAESVMTDAEDGVMQKTKEELLDELASLKKEIKRLKLERDVLRVTAEIIKKDPGVDPKNLANREKTLLVDALRNEHSLKDLLDYVRIPRSSYFYQHGRLLAKDKYGDVKEKIGRLFQENGGRYGYRRIHALLRREGEKLSEKIVRRIMTESALVVFGRKKRKYSSYQGEKTPGAENLVSRDFHADAPNRKWLTDITEFPLPAGKVYLSPIIDCFDGMIVSWSMGTSPEAELVNSMLDMATATLGERERPIVHSDRGAHYRWPGWIERMEAAGLSRSMSKKGCSPDNAACEGFFGRLKNEMFYNRKWQGVSIDEFMDILDNYLCWYNERRIKISLGAKSPLEYRRSLDLVA